MSRGYGVWQRAILRALETTPMVRLTGENKSETTAIKRAAVGLAAAGKLVLVRLWADDPGERRRVCTFAFPVGFLVKGEPVEKLIVDRVPLGTRSTFIGSLRYCAMGGASVTTVWRVLKQTAGTKDQGGDAPPRCVCCVQNGRRTQIA